MRDYTAANRKFVKVALQEFSKTGATNYIVNILSGEAQKVISFIDDNFNKESDKYPVYTGNLHDATGVGIYANGRLYSYKPASIASSPQMSEGHPNIIGETYLSEAISLAVSNFPTGIWLVLFSAVPYADVIERMGSPKERGTNFFTNLTEVVQLNITSALGKRIEDSNLSVLALSF